MWWLLIASALPWSKLCPKDAADCVLRRDVSYGTVRTMWGCAYYEAESVVSATVALRHVQRASVRGGRRGARDAIEALVPEVTRCLDDAPTTRVRASAVIDRDGDVVDIDADSDCARDALASLHLARGARARVTWTIDYTLDDPTPYEQLACP